MKRERTGEGGLIVRHDGTRRKGRVSVGKEGREGASRASSFLRSEALGRHESLIAHVFGSKRKGPSIRRPSRSDLFVVMPLE